MVSVLILMNVTALYRTYKEEKDPINKTQLKFFLVATAFFCFSAIDYFLNYPVLAEKLNIELYPFGVFIISFSLLVFVLSHFITLNLTLENRVKVKTAQLKESVQALEEAAQYKKDFIANVTHELRTPLTLIRGWTDFIIEGESGKITDKLLEIMNKISFQTLNLTQKINELLKVSKFDAGMTNLVLKKENIHSVIIQIVDSFKEIADKSSIALNYSNRSKIEAVFIDIEKLKDILNNLIRNAYKFTEKGEINVSLDQSDGMIIIKVRDTGIGMSQKVIKNIFERFQQGDSSRTRKFEGTGLGLAIVKESAELMHGKISVKSVEKKGTVFTVRLPLNIEKLEPGAIIERRVNERRVTSRGPDNGDRRHKTRRLNDLARVDEKDLVKISKFEKTISSDTVIKKIEPDKSSRGTIVIAEDNKAIQDFLTIALKGYTLFIAPNGQTAWQAVLDFNPDMLISDIMMPVMDGYTLLKHIRNNEKTSNLPVIVITSLTEQDDRIKSLQLGADDYLTKPFHHLELQARVKNVLSIHKLAREKTRSEQLEIFLMVLASVIESKDQYTGGHVERVAGYARDIAKKAGLSENQINSIYLGTIVHDVGKIGIKDKILNKPGKLTREEFEHIKGHPLIGKKLLSKLKIAPMAVNIAFCHQEKWDGSGYPCGLKGEEIPIEARIASIADVWDAITSDRPYRKAMSLEKAVDVMHQERGRSFDPELFDLFMDKGDRLYLNYTAFTTN